MINLKIILITSLFACAACEKDAISDPDLVLGPIEVIVSDLVDSVRVESITTFRINISRENYLHKFALKIDTLFPSFEFITLKDENVNKLVKGGCEITIDGQSFAKIDSISTGEHLITFSNPKVVGVYDFSIQLTANDGTTYSETIKYKVFSPPVIVKFYEVDPWLELGIYDKNFYEILNRDYTYNPLSPVFKNKRVDTIYTKEMPMAGNPDKYTIKGKGITIYVGQERGKDFYFKEGIKYDENIYALRPEWNTTTPSLSWQGQGFHCLDFWVMEERIGETTYTIEFYDFYGKKVEDSITVVVFDRNTDLPTHGHIIPD